MASLVIVSSLEVSIQFFTYSGLNTTLNFPSTIFIQSLRIKPIPYFFKTSKQNNGSNWLSTSKK